MAERLFTTPRRSMQQIIHCVEEALAAHEADEQSGHVIADLEQASELIDRVITTFKSGKPFVE